jgi:hypothetical protein
VRIWASVSVGRSILEPNAAGFGAASDADVEHVEVIEATIQAAPLRSQPESIGPAGPEIVVMCGVGEESDQLASRLPPSVDEHGYVDVQTELAREGRDRRDAGRGDNPRERRKGVCIWPLAARLPTTMRGEDIESNVEE